jgi:hypothetical protein
MKHPCAKVIVAYASGKKDANGNPLSGDEVTKVTAHLKECEECMEEISLVHKADEATA